MMSCFFCQSLLSDYIEALLPAGRHDEIKGHVEGCLPCRGIEKEVRQVREILAMVTSPGVSHELSLRVAEASLSGKRTWLSSAKVSRATLTTLVPILLILGLAVTFPSVFPWISRFQPNRDESHFVRYFPMLQGAPEIVEEQSAWLQAREPYMRSLWEEGGLSPEEFEKTFTPTRNAPAKAEAPAGEPTGDVEP